MDVNRQKWLSGIGCALLTRISVTLIITRLVFPEAKKNKIKIGWERMDKVMARERFIELMLKEKEINRS